MIVMSATRLRLALLSALVVYQLGRVAYTQEPSSVPRFEVASVKPCPERRSEPLPGERKGDARQSSPDRLHLTCQTLMSIIQWAYVNYANARFEPLASVPISGGPAWINTEQFQIDAKADGPQSSGMMNGPMLRALLEERFGLVIRRDVKETPVYALVVAKGAALRISRSTRNCVVSDPERPLRIEPGKPFPALCGGSRVTDKGFDAVAVSMARFAEVVSDYADKKVIDRTGLSGEFDIHLNLSASELGHPPTGANDEEAKLARDPAQVFAKVRAELRRLGLNIEAATAPAEALFIEKAEKPSDN